MSLISALRLSSFFNMPRVLGTSTKLLCHKQPSLSSLTRQMRAMSLTSKVSSLTFDSLIKPATTVPPSQKELYFSELDLQKKQYEHIHKTLSSENHAQICAFILLAPDIVKALRTMFENTHEHTFSAKDCEHLIICMSDLADFYDKKLIYYVVKYYCCNYLEDRLKNPPTNPDFYKTIIRILLLRDKYTLNFINDRSDDCDATQKKVTKLLQQALIFYCDTVYPTGALSSKLAFMLDDFSKESNHFPDLKDAANSVITTSLQRLSEALIHANCSDIGYAKWPLNMLISLYISCLDITKDSKKLVHITTILKARLVQDYIAAGEKEKLMKKYVVRNPSVGTMPTGPVLDCDALLQERAELEIQSLNSRHGS